MGLWTNVNYSKSAKCVAKSDSVGARRNFNVAFVGKVGRLGVEKLNAEVMRSIANKPSCLGVIYGNRDFFPDQLVAEARADLAKVCERAGVRAIQLSEKESKLGGVETHAEARKCAEL